MAPTPGNHEWDRLHDGYEPFWREVTGETPPPYYSFRAGGWQVLSVTVFAYYLFWNERLFMLPWHSEPWLRGFILIPPFVALLFALRRQNLPNEFATRQS